MYVLLAAVCMQMVIDALLLCVLKDSETSDGSEVHRYLMSAHVMVNKQLNTWAKVTVV